MIKFAGQLPALLGHPVPGSILQAGKRTVSDLFAAVEKTPGYRLRIDLPSQTTTTPDGAVMPFAVNQYRKERLVSGLDDIALTLEQVGRIASYEKQRWIEEP